MTGINTTYLLRSVDQWGNDVIHETQIGTTIKFVVEKIWVIDRIVGVYQLVTREVEGADNVVEIYDVTIDTAQRVLTDLALSLKNNPVYGWSRCAAAFAERFFPDAVDSLRDEWEVNCYYDNQRRDGKNGIVRSEKE